jgi:long-chain acyl-CoA synthetase
MKNCMEWFIAEQAIFCVSGATVPFYDTLGPESVEYILKQTGTKSVVCTRAASCPLPRWKPLVRRELPLGDTNIVHPHPKIPLPFVTPRGTTGDPKGALLSHENMMAVAAGFSDVLPIEVWDRHLSYLPLAHPKGLAWSPSKNGFRHLQARHCVYSKTLEKCGRSREGFESPHSSNHVRSSC